jgi:hypothetical protein
MSQVPRNLEIYSIVIYIIRLSPVITTCDTYFNI